jgi:hypothetical protein
MPFWEVKFMLTASNVQIVGAPWRLRPSDQSIGLVLALWVMSHHRQAACGRMRSWLVMGEAKPLETSRRRRAPRAGAVLLCLPGASALWMVPFGCISVAVWVFVRFARGFLLFGKYVNHAFAPWMSR